MSPIPGVEGWSYGAFQEDREERTITVPVVRDDGQSTQFTVPEFLADPQDLRRIASIVVEAFEKWENVKGLGA